MVGSDPHRKFLLVDPKNHPDAVGIADLAFAKRPERSGGYAADRDARVDRRKDKGPPDAAATRKAATPTARPPR